jgi:hypothetical protein
MDDIRFAGFVTELCAVGDAGFEKLALKETRRGKGLVRAQKHFDSSDPNWNEFEKNLRTKGFQRAVVEHPQADDKLKRYVKNYGGYLTSKDVIAKEPSETKPGKTYAIKKVGKRTACGCGDWQYKKSHGGGDCKHIAKYKKSTMTKLSEQVKRAFAEDLLHASTLVAAKKVRAAKKNQLGLQTNALNQQLREGEQAQRRQGY